MKDKIRLPAILMAYVMIVYFYFEYVISREVSNYILWPSTIVIFYLTWETIKLISKQIFNKL
jgi:hypothetical protein